MYDEYENIKNFIISGTDAAGTITGALLSEIPIIGPIIGFVAGSLLGYGLLKILEQIPHETYRGQLAHDKEAGRKLLASAILNTRQKIRAAVNKIKVQPNLNQKMIPWSSINGKMQPITVLNGQIEPLKPLVVNEGFGKEYISDEPHPQILRPKYKVIDHPRKAYQFNATIPASGGFR